MNKKVLNLVPKLLIPAVIVALLILPSCTAGTPEISSYTIADSIGDYGYPYAAALTQPMDHDWGQIYLYIATQTYRRWGKNEMPADIAVDSLNDYQLAELKRFKDWLYQQRTKIRLERDRAERRQRKEEGAAKRKTEQPALFEF